MMRGADTEAVAAALRGIAEANGGTLTPDAVWQAARDPASPLHAHFTWDTKAAAEKCWREEARTLIRSVRLHVDYMDLDVRIPAYLRDPDAMDEGRSGYVALGSLENDGDRAERALEEEFGRALAHLRRAHAVAVALGLAGRVNDLIRRVAGVLAVVRTPPKDQKVASAPRRGVPPAAVIPKASKAKRRGGEARPRG